MWALSPISRIRARTGEEETIMSAPESAVAAPPRCRTDSLEFGAYSGAVPSARLHCRAVLEEWGLAQLLDEAESVVAETMANAVQGHPGRGPGHLRPAGPHLRRIWRNGGGLGRRAASAGPGQPRRRQRARPGSPHRRSPQRLVGFSTGTSGPWRRQARPGSHRPALKTDKEHLMINTSDIRDGMEQHDRIHLDKL